MINQALSYYITYYLSYLRQIREFLRTIAYVCYNLCTKMVRYLNINMRTQQLLCSGENLVLDKKEEHGGSLPAPFYWNITVIGWRSHIATANISNRELITMLGYGFRLEGSPKDTRDIGELFRLYFTAPYPIMILFITLLKNLLLKVWRTVVNFDQRSKVTTKYSLRQSKQYWNCNILTKIILPTRTSELKKNKTTMT